MKANLRIILDKHTGRENAISRKELYWLLDFEHSGVSLSTFDRKMRLAIGELRRDGFPILFSTSKPTGYYLPKDRKELIQGINQLRSYIIDECITVRNLKVKGLNFIDRERQGMLI